MHKRGRMIKLRNGEIESFWYKGKLNPCNCGSNLFHEEFDGEILHGVCNSCDKDIFIFECDKNYIRESEWEGCLGNMEFVLTLQGGRQIIAELGYASDIIEAKEYLNKKVEMKEWIMSAETELIDPSAVIGIRINQEI